MASVSTITHGFNFGGEKARRLEAHLAAIARENARRRPCPRCDLLVLPETQARHDAIHHEGSSSC